MTKKFSLYGKNFFGDDINLPSKGLITDRFTIPPFSILNAREGVWQSRKKKWLGFGIKSETGRDSAPGGSPMVMSYDKNGIRLVGLKNYDPKKIKQKIKKEENKAYTTQHKLSDGSMMYKKTVTSIFDPVLCELMYKWFCPPNGQIIDPFAGGSVRGIVAHLLGFQYWGCDLSERQIDANNEQANKITPDNKPIWICGDSTKELKNAPEADFIFSCPPYGDLEKYSDDPRDISNMNYDKFLDAYYEIIKLSCKQLKNNRFACFTVGDFRNKNGFYNDFVSETINAFIEVGLNLYNECILITAVGSLPIRITKQFEAARKMGKTHQNILVFIKGDPKKATKKLKGETK